MKLSVYLIECHVMIEYGGVGMSSACYWIEVSGHLHPLAVLPLVKVIQVPIEQEDGWVLEPEWMLWREEKPLVPPRNQTMIPQSCSP
jgi:hypothetical protein